MHCQTAKTAVDFLIPAATRHAKEMTEAEYFAACVRHEARLRRRTPVRMASTALAALRASRAVQWIVTGAARRQDAAALAVLLRGDLRILRDIGIADTGLGGHGLEDPEGQSADRLAASPAPAIVDLPGKVIRVVPDTRPTGSMPTLVLAQA